eukprot:TRINITY_DN3323_c0_g2_i1.p1 TRINITY_DN3323_c0_g2~~TRINITY_DN3323_c0_g2_i1.p1  ORF type:complete len:312 (+),score=71.06 TRINITY_DN3323_c0_g2_i1:74-1009(+)
MEAMALLERLGGGMSAGDTSTAFAAVLKSFAQFAAAPVVAARCVYAVAMNTKMADLEEFRAAFEHCDRDGDGFVSRGDLHSALHSAAAAATDIVDPYALFSAADVDNRGFLDFRKFAAACLYERLAPLDDWLARQAFVALDTDADGWLSARDVFTVFGFVPTGLPSFRIFDLGEWIDCLRPTMQAESAAHATNARDHSKECGLGLVGAHDESKQCGLGLDRGGLGLLAGCMKKRSHRRQASAFEAVDETSEVYRSSQQENLALAMHPPQMYSASHALYPPSTCSQAAWMVNQQHAHGMPLSSPAYAPYAHY